MKMGYSTLRITNTELLKTLMSLMYIADKKNLRYCSRPDHRTLHVTRIPKCPDVSLFFFLSEVLPELLKEILLETCANILI
ncbi:hypothetical protein PR048_002092 [Dryococelus australis]|uniref:Uncharacterized protein n=1 Tax=Dryococelus australis TaxID=614101 RepID=A0ABQ9IJ73_9NEOP|nr:hypothetical protein PR048_002092 [Dryococelus australis]